MSETHSAEKDAGCSCRYYEVGEPYVCPMHFHVTRTSGGGA